MSSLPSTVAAQPTAEVVPITKMITDTFTKDPVFAINAVVAGLAILYYLICQFNLKTRWGSVPCRLMSRSLTTRNSRQSDGCAKDDESREKG